MKSKVKKNFIYQFLYNIVTLVVPLIITPFLTRTLLENGIGEFTYSRSIASYFVVFAMLGIVKYGQRIISKNSDNTIILRKKFWSLFIVHVLFSLISLLCFALIASFFFSDNKILLFIQIIYVFSALFDVTWLFYGLEDFKCVVIVNICLKIIESILYFSLIKGINDIYLYAIINSSFFLASNVILFVIAIRRLRPISVALSDCKEHIKPLFVLALAVVGITLYTIFDTTLLGVFSSKSNVAFYEYSNRIVKIPLTIASIIGTVLYPRACKLVARGDGEGQKKYLSISMIVVSFVASASIFGLLIIGDPLAEIYLGDSFMICGRIMKSLSPLIFIVAIGDILRTQIMIPNGMDKQYIASIMINAVVNLIISTILLILLPEEYKVFGAVIGTLSAETCGLLFQFILCRSYINIKDLLGIFVASFSIGLIMFLVLKIIVNYVLWDIVTLLFVVILGGAVFVPLMLIYLLFFRKETLKTLLNKK